MGPEVFSYRVCKISPLICSWARLIHPVHTVLSNITKITFRVIRQWLGLLYDAFPLGLPAKTPWAYAFSPVHATYRVHQILIDVL